MEAKIFVIGFPSVSSVMEKITSAIEDAFDIAPKCCGHKAEKKKPCCCKQTPSFGAPLPPWGVNTEEPANENLRFGYQATIDEPRCEDYDKRWQFESDHAAFDRFVDAAEDCVARGLEKKSDAPIHKCKAIRKRLGDAPPMNIDLIGETHWWEDINCDDDWF